MAKPIIAWYNSAHSAQVATPFDFGVIDAGDESNVFTFNIWNNKNGEENVSKMEDCTITTRDMDGGTGDTVGKIVQSVRDNWFHAQIDTLGEFDLNDSSSLIGKNYSKVIGTLGTTKHRGSQSATAWTASKTYTIGQTVIPSISNGKFYRCTTSGISGGTPPVWSIVDGATVSDGAVVWEVIAINNTPARGEILGVANDGTPTNGAGNFVTATIQAQVPLSADAGRQNIKLRVSYRYV